MKRVNRAEPTPARPPLQLLGEGADGSVQNQLDFLLAINESLGEGVYATDVAGHFTFVNPAAQRMLGWSGPGLLGRQAHPTIHDRGPDGRGDSLARCPLLGVMRSGRAWSGEEQLTRRDGSTFPALVSSAPVRSDDRIVGAVVAFRDDSERRRAELRVRDAEDVAADQAMAAARARSEAHSLAELERTKSHLLQVASHELRSPIAVLAGYLQMLADGSLGEVTPATGRVLPILIEKVSEMNELVNAMLETVRVQSGDVAPEPLSIDLRRVAEQVAGSVAPTLAAGLAVRVRVPSAPVLVLADESGVVNILHHLLDNAIKYSPAGGAIEIEVTAGENLASVAVRDPGIGIAPEHVPELFSRFGRIVTPENSHIRGAGLGLWLSRELARAQGGDIEVVSEPARGATFTLTLPFEPPSG